ncbi:MAG: esterase, partial [Pseudomonadota bacterium]|nr:esterase [Pseudomonadota bacterium]
YNGEKWVLTQSHLDALLKIDTPVTRLRNYLLLLETGDEILDWQDAARHYHGAEQKIFPGGNHAFTRFQACLPQILAFAGLASSANIPCNPID